MGNQEINGVKIGEEDLVRVSGGTGGGQIYTYEEVKIMLEQLFQEYNWEVRVTRSPLYGGEKFREAAEEIASHGKYNDIYDRRDVANLIDIYAGLLDKYLLG